MRFSIFAAAASLLACVSAQATDSPYAQTVLKDLNNTRAQLIKFNQTLNLLTPGNPANTGIALAIQAANDNIVKALNQTIIDAQKIPGQLSDDDTLTIASAVGALETPIKSVLSNVIRKKPQFAKAIFGFGDLSKTVRADLVILQKRTQVLGDTLSSKASDTYASIGPALTAEVVGLYNDAIAAYDKCTGAVCLPPINF